MQTLASEHKALTGNGLLASLSAEQYGALFPHLEVLRLEQQQSVHEVGEAVTYVYFPAGSVVAGVAIMTDGATVETSMIGSEGVVGVVAMFGESRASQWTRVLLPGEALRMRASVLRELFEEDAGLQKIFLRYYSTLISQISRRAVCNTRHHLFDRLCTWLLMVHDRADGDDLQLTQEAIARQLGVRRAGVNEAVGRLEKLRLIDHSRGRLRLNDRRLLEATACLCYREMKEEMVWHENHAEGISEVWPPGRVYTEVSPIRQ